MPLTRIMVAAAVWLAAGAVTGAGAATPADRYGDPLPEGAVARLGTLRFRHEWGIYSAALSPDGRLVAAGGRTIRLWDAATGKELRRLGGPDVTTYALAFTPDSKTLASWGDDQALRFWDAGTGKELRCLKPYVGKPPNKDLPTAYLAFTAGGRAVLLNGFDLKLRLLDAATGKELRAFPGPGRHAYAPALSADGRRLAVGDEDKGIRVWDAEGGKELCRLPPPRSETHCVAFAPDGRLLATGDDGAARLWDAATGKVVRSLPVPGHRVVSLAFTPDGKTLVTGDSPLAHDGLAEVDVRRHGKEPAAGTPTSDVRVWDVAAGRLLRQFAHPARRGLAFLPDGKTLFAGGDNGWGEGAVHFLDVTTGQEVRRFDGHDTRVEAVAFSPDGRLVATGAADGDGPIRLWEAANGKPVRRLGGRTRGARKLVLAFSPDGNTLAAGGYTGQVTLWDVAAGEAVRGFRPHRHNVLCLVFSADGKTLTTSASYDSTVCVTGVATGKEVRNFRVMKERIWGVVLSPDAALAACDSQDDDMVYLWDVTAGKELRRVSRQASGSISLAFSADGRTLATQDGRTVRLWEVATGLERRSLRLPGLTAAVAFSPGGRLLAWAGASANNDKFTVNLLDLASGKPLRAWAGHQSYIGALAFSPDGRRLASVSADTTGLLWATPPPGEARLKRAEREAAWRDLGEIDAAKAYTAVLALASDPEGTAPFLKEQLRLAAAALPERFTRLVADLDSDRFEVRAKAKEELAQLGPGAEPLLRKALERPPSPEVRKALQELLGRLEAGQLRDLRAVEALETLGTPPARELLQELSRGEAGARLTREAQASLRRLAHRPAGQK